jgi:hypothetical protein
VSRVMRSSQSGTVRQRTLSPPMLPVTSRDAPYPWPRPDGRLRIAFVGQATYFRACSLEHSDAQLATTFIDFRAGRDVLPVRAALEAFAPHAIVVFRPEILPPGALADMRVPVLGFLTEPIVRREGPEAHWDLEHRHRELSRLDPDNVDRIVSFDPLIVPTADRIMPVWRSLPLPVSDRLFRPVRRVRPPAGLLFVGRSTWHREEYLAQAKYRFDVLHVAFGAGLEELERLLDRFTVTFNVHNEPYPSFENRVLLHLAAGHLVISEPLSPSHGLEAGRDYLEIDSPEQLTEAAAWAREAPVELLPVRLAGRAKAQISRASRVWPALVRDLYLDLRAFGTHRRAGAG